MFAAALLFTMMLQADAAPAEKAACDKPTLIERPGISADEVRAVLTRVQSYLTCMQKAIDAQHERANAAITTANAEAKKSNDMVADVNVFITAAKNYQAEHSGN